jgi:hypothetical protein
MTGLVERQLWVVKGRGEKIRFTPQQALKALGGGSHRHAPVVLPPGKRFGIHYTGDWMGPMVGLDRYGKFSLHRDYYFFFVRCARSPDCPVRSYTDCAIPGPRDGLSPV